MKAILITDFNRDSGLKSDNFIVNNCDFNDIILLISDTFYTVMDNTTRK